MTHVKSIGYDEQAQRRWIGYISKEMKYMIEQGFTPIYRWDDEHVEPIKCTNNKLKKESIIYTHQLVNDIWVVRPVGERSVSAEDVPVARETNIIVTF